MVLRTVRFRLQMLSWELQRLSSYGKPLLGANSFPVCPQSWEQPRAAGLVQEHCSGSHSRSSAWEENSADFEPELSRAAIREVLK